MTGDSLFAYIRWICEGERFLKACEGANGVCYRTRHLNCWMLYTNVCDPPVNVNECEHAILVKCMQLMCTTFQCFIRYRLIATSRCSTRRTHCFSESSNIFIYAQRFTVHVFKWACLRNPLTWPNHKLCISIQHYDVHNAFSISPAFVSQSENPLPEDGISPIVCTTAAVYFCECGCMLFQSHVPPQSICDVRIRWNRVINYAKL